MQVGEFICPGLAILQDMICINGRHCVLLQLIAFEYKMAICISAFDNPATQDPQIVFLGSK